MSANLSIGKDINGAISDTIYISKDKYAVTLTANIAESITVPENVDSVYFSFGSSGDVWVDCENTAVIPGGSFAATTSELRPVSRFVRPGQHISFICAFVNPVQVSFYNLRGG